VPVTVNCCFVPLAIDGRAGVTAIETNVAVVTVSVAVPTTVPRVAVMAEVPTATPVARPEVVMVAVAGVAEAHVAVAERSCVVMTLVVGSLKVPIATNCCLVPFAIDGVAGVTAIETRAAVVTVSVVEPTTVPLVAETTDVPAPTPVARPPAEIVAAVSVADAHVTEAETSFVDVSLYVPVATNCCVVPLAIVGVAGVTAIDTSVAGAVTVSATDPLTPPLMAVITVVPGATPVARPAAEIVAVAVVTEVQLAVVVMVWVVPSE
jgi:hypothetical protein